MTGILILADMNPIIEIKNHFTCVPFKFLSLLNFPNLVSLIEICKLSGEFAHVACLSNKLIKSLKEYFLLFS